MNFAVIFYTMYTVEWKQSIIYVLLDSYSSKITTCQTQLQRKETAQFVNAKKNL